MFELKSMRRLKGFGMVAYADSFLHRPTSADQIPAILSATREAGKQIVVRGAGRSYGDPAVLAEGVAIDTSGMKRVLRWDATSGLLTAEPGATLMELCQHVLPDGWYLPVVSGTAKTSIGGAVSMNIHGKNNWQRGPIGEHVRAIEVVLADGSHRKIEETDPLFRAFVSGAGLLGVITSVTIQMKHAPSGKVRVQAVSCSNWDEQFKAFEKYEGDAEYVVSWIDGFGTGDESGRGLLHAGWMVETEDIMSRQPEKQTLPSRIMGLFPKSEVWRVLRLLNNRIGMKTVNALKYLAGKREHGSEYFNSLAEFNYLLDFVPGWERAYEPWGLIQCQYFVPKEHAPRVFPLMMAMQRAVKLETFLAVLKRHRPDDFLMSHAVDGYSLALDFKVTESNRKVLWSLAQKMNDLAIEHGGRMYLAKDMTMTAAQAKGYLGPNYDRFVELRRELDPDQLFTSEMAKRLGLEG